MGNEARERVQRYDLASGAVTGRRTTPQGGLVARARMTRTGVFEYRNPDGTVRRELRPPDEVFDPDSLATLAHSTLTDDHPSTVHPGNWRNVTIGHVAGEVKPDDARFVAGDFHIQHGDAIRKANDGALSEVSCGYECQIDPTPGIYEGKPYDVVQRKIRYNHVALGPVGWGRAGGEVRMRLDSSTAISSPDGPPLYVPAMAETDNEKQARLDAEKRTNDRLDALQTQVNTLSADKARLEGELAVFRQNDTAVKTAKERQDAEQRADAELNARLRAFDDARRFMGADFKRERADGRLKSIVEVQREIIERLEPGVPLDGRDAAYIQGVYDGAIHRADSAEQGRAELQLAGHPFMSTIQGGAGGHGGGRSDAGRGRAPMDEPDEDDDPETRKAQDAMVARQRDRWKTPPRSDRTRGYDSGRTVPRRPDFSGGNQGDNAGSFGVPIR